MKTYKLVKKEDIETNVIHEDELWTPMVLGNATKILPTHIIHYYYRQRKDSL